MDKECSKLQQLEHTFTFLLLFLIRKYKQFQAIINGLQGSPIGT